MTKKVVYRAYLCDNVYHMHTFCRWLHLVCTVCAPFDFYIFGVHTNQYNPEICAHVFCHGAHLFSFFFLMSTLVAFCMHFMSKSVLTRSVLISVLQKCAHKKCAPP